MSRSYLSSGTLIVVLISLLSLVSAVFVGNLLKSWESASVDLRMRWRYKLNPCPKQEVHPDVCLVAINHWTEIQIGRFGGGDWISRRPFYNQLTFFENYLRPSVLGYDIIFKEAGQVGSADVPAVSDSPERIRGIIAGLSKVAGDSNETLHGRVLDDMNKFTTEQGTLCLAHRLASMDGQNLTKPIMGFSFRGGDVDLNAAKIPLWSDKDVFGADEKGDENSGRKVPYLKDIAIPSVDIHFTGGVDEADYGYSPNGTLPELELLDYSYLGCMNVPRDSDSTIVRRIPLVLGSRYFNSITDEMKKVFVPSFDMMACLLHLGVKFPLSPGVVEVYMGKKVVIHSPANGEFNIPVDENGYMYLNFDAELHDFRTVSFANVAPVPELVEKGRKALAEWSIEDINDRIVIVGVTATGVDVGDTPLSSNIPLVYVHLMAINNILNKDFISPLGKSGCILFMAVFFLFYTIVCVLEKGARQGPFSVLLSLFYAIAAYAGVHWSLIIIPVITPLTYIGLCSFAVLSYRFFVEERAKRRIRGMFSTMVSDKVLSFLEEQPDSFSLTGQDVDATVFFSDIANFTSISEPLPPERLTRLLNSYLTPVTDSILDHGGYLDKYVGDMVMAVWGAPYNDPEHAFAACESALAQQELIAGMKADLNAEYESDICVRMGIASGTVTAGNMGSEKKFQYTVMGDVVNLASRLEPVNKDFGTSIIIDEATRLLCGDRIVVRQLTSIVVKGKKEIVFIYELLGKKGQVDAAKLKIIADYEAAYRAFSNRKWQTCLGILDQILDSGDSPAAHLKERTLFLIEHPPAPEWHGELVRDIK
ncbi:MAG: adenylate/guanylate cyclase domain-containing protein [Kiritimatiellae bacterium]|nr:adenylate/guanylate cyclase domain-containing protein [Kiritimatiellia bacterium]